MLDGLRLGWVKGPKGNIICACLSRFHREMATVVTGNANLRVAAKQFACFANVTITLTQMHAVSLQPFGERYAVVNDKRYIMRGADCLQGLCQGSSLMLVHILYAKLECGDWPRR
jgi:hypothetical protein